MNSNRQTAVSGDLTAKKPNGKDVVSSADTVKEVGQTGVTLPTSVSGDSESRKSNGKAVVSSAKPVKRDGQTGFSLATTVSGDPKSKKPNGKAVVSSTAEMMFFKDVKFGPQVGELRFRLIHFWEARNAHTKVLIGLEMLLIDEQVYSYIYDFVSVLLGRSNTNVRCFYFLLPTGYCDPRVHPTKQD